MAGSDFKCVLDDELDSIQAARGQSQVQRGVNECDDPIGCAHRVRLTCLALSGGSIRRATFNLGVLHALTELTQLRDFDYLSTVSGGGYIGCWLSAWINRQQDGLAGVVSNLMSGAPGHERQQEPRAISHLPRLQQLPDVTQRTFRG